MPSKYRTGRNVRGTAEYLGGTRIKFTWACGHTETKDYSKGPRPKRMGETGCRLMGHWWSKDSGGVNLPPCKRCQKKERWK